MSLTFSREPETEKKKHLISRWAHAQIGYIIVVNSILGCVHSQGEAARVFDFH